MACRTGRGHVALRQKVTAQTVANFLGVDAVILFFFGCDGPKHQRMRYLQRGSMRFQVIVNPARKHRGFHRRAPRLRQCFHSTIQIVAGRGNPAFAVKLASAVLHAVADHPLVHIQDRCNTYSPWRSLLGVSESARPPSSFCKPSALPSTYTFKLTRG
jgi:hypothetical protein